MLKVLSSVIVDHDPGLIAFTVAICALGSLIALRLFMRALAAEGVSRRQGLLMAGTAAGATAWATHFLAMLAFAPAIASFHLPFLATLSLLIAILALTAAFSAAAGSSPELGGALAGLGIGAMHYTAMAGFRVAGTVQWDMGYVALSLAVGIALGMLATHLARAVAPERRLRLGAVAAFVLAICGLHFTGMAAVAIRPDPLVEVPLGAVPKHIMVAFIAAVASLVLAIWATALLADRRARAESHERLRRLAHAAIEGLIIVKDGRIVDVNKSFEELTGYRHDEIVNRGLFEKLLMLDSDAETAEALKGEGVLRGADGRLIPVKLRSKPADAPAGSHVVSVRDLTEKKSAEGRIDYLAHFDPLTGLPNRRSFLDRLVAEIGKAQERSEGFALLSFDLDRFKEANDRFGHAVGDQVLAEIARRLKVSLKACGYAARFGGDEFLAILSDAGKPEQIMAFADDILAALRAPMTIAGHEVQIGASAGIALFPDDARTAAELMAHADLALHRAIDIADGRACFFESGMDSELRQKRTLARDLRRALAEGGFELHYQPQSRLADNCTIGYEALIRWRHPTRGLISPAEFIPVAEETGLIVSIGEWVLREACATAASWAEPYRIAVNLSPVQFSQGGLPETVHAILVETGLSPKRLELEVTESLVTSDPDIALHVLRRLKALGVSVAMDDFGTGYSSLSMLQSFPFDKIKIDRSFLDKLGKQHKSASIIRAVLALGRSLEIPVLAEGIETKAHLDFLREAGCDEAQGYFLGRPMPAGMIFPQAVMGAG